MPPPRSTDSPGSPAAADLVLRNGIVHTLDAGATIVEAVAVRRGEIVALGTSADMAAHAGPQTTLIELDGRSLIPGINDGHLHAAWLGASWPNLLLESSSFHTAPLRTGADRRRALTRAWRLLASLGITSYTEPGIGPGEDAGETGCFGTSVLETYLELAGTGPQTARVTLLRLFGRLDGPSRFADFARGMTAGVPPADSRWLAVRGVKIFADGIPPVRSAWLRTPYLDGSFGALLTGDGDAAQRLAEFAAMVELAHSNGLQIGVHATGDRTIEEFIAIVARLGGAAGLRHYIIHGDMIDATQLSRMAQLGIGIALQPLVAGLARPWMAEAVPAEAIKAAFPLHLMLNDGLQAILSSDAPVASPDWRKSIAAMAQHCECHGLPVGRPELTKLLRMYTSGPAAQDGALDWKGTLETGKAADFCVLAADPYAAGARGLPGIEVDMTIVDGRVVFRRDDAA